MARGLASFSSDGRQRLAGVLRALLIGQLVVSLCMVIFCYNTSMKVLMLLKHIHKTTVFFLYGLLLLQAYCMKLHYTSGLRLMSWFVRGPYWSRVTAVSTAWMIGGSCVAVNGLLVYAGCRSTLGALMMELSSSLRVGIAHYLSEPTWKRLLDTMQVELSCCGAEKPSDWHDIAWLNMDFLNEESDLVMKLARTDGIVTCPVTPYSCCTPRVLAACYHDPLQQAEWRSVWSGQSPLVSASLHTRGCVEAVRAPLTKALLALQVLNMLVLLFQSLIVILTQLLRSSARDAILRGNCDGPGTGCLFRPRLLEKEHVEKQEEPSTSTQHRVNPVEACAVTMTRRRRRRRVRSHCSYPYLS